MMICSASRKRLVRKVWISRTFHHTQPPDNRESGLFSISSLLGKKKNPRWPWEDRYRYRYRSRCRRICFIGSRQNPRTRRNQRHLQPRLRSCHPLSPFQRHMTPFRLQNIRGQQNLGRQWPYPIRLLPLQPLRLHQPLCPHQPLRLHHR